MALRKEINVITASVEIIERKQVPHEFYLPYPKKKKSDWKNIFKFTFSNEFIYYYGSNKPYVNCKELLINVSLESAMVSSSKNPFILKKLFMETFNSDVNIPNCKKIYNWLKHSQKQIDDILDQFLIN